ncbi:ATP-binding protein [Idiomarina sp.]|uniref:ATP-binding protein n=1 Tax=Idiomarina sp. TaxID=1874361 RepID=UPI002E9D6DC6|nr:ATP-binding protein [Pseudomonadota bacterium]
MASMSPRRWFGKTNMDVPLHTIQRLYEPLQLAIICFDRQRNYLWHNTHFDTLFKTASSQKPRWLIEPLTSILDSETASLEIEHPIQAGKTLNVYQHRIAQYRLLTLSDNQQTSVEHELSRLVGVFTQRLAGRALEPTRQSITKVFEQSHGQMPDSVAECLKNQRVYITQGLEWLSLINAKLNLQPIRWCKLIEPVEEAFAFELRRIGGSVVNNCQHSALVDANLATTLVYELVENAIKFRDTCVPLKISVVTEVTEMGHCRLIVEDNGIGIYSELDERAMLPFQRGSDLSTAGVGIGLAKCALIAIRHQADISAFPMGERGTRIEVTWRTRARN